MDPRFWVLMTNSDEEQFYLLFRGIGREARRYAASPSSKFEGATLSSYVFPITYNLPPVFQNSIPS